MEEDSQTQAQETQASPQTPAPQGSSSKKGPIIYAAILLLLLLGAAAFYFGLKSRKSSEGASPTPAPSSTSTPTPEEETQESPTPTPTPTATPTPTPVSQTMTLSAAASLDGFQSNNGGGNTGIEIRSGRNSNLITRGFVSFDISGIPAGKTIDLATLRLYQTSITGNPYGVGGSLKVDHLDYGSSFENADYNASSLSSSFGTLTSNAAIEWKDLDVTDRLKADISSGRTRSQYRVHFATETIGGDVTGDFTNFESANNSTGTGNTPQLVVKYH
ncbi:hypothetical protein A2115_00780 [Candidatus Woesebacteria bacterium GWA1_41_8]|uniref:Carbohydrate-binding module family 96 domain-containing protein n=1 Tax=Candidatus Woesebacteria bacterium GWA1_41_8 TaxID=1802471 RepID=A0A1F7WI45_9BACT|nr:MAG: hypothetical protein A2115_00780 [Candidatus Woesebacteria bacterium GWA1_41_8]